MSSGDRPSIAEQVGDRWDPLLRSLGLEEGFFRRKHGPCPACGGKDRYRYIGNGGYFCGDERGDGVQLVQHALACGFDEAARLIHERLGDAPPEKREPTYAERLSHTAVKSTRSAYLASRGLEVAPGLRWAHAVDYRDDGRVMGQFAAMLAPVTRDGRFLTYHVTYLSAGAKASVPSPRKILPGPAINGASVALYTPAEVMGVAEGIETAIAAKMIHGMPVWSALNTSLMKAWQPPEIARRIVIFADHDRNWAGHAAAYELAHRLCKTRDVEVRMPEDVGDWNDALLAQRTAA